MTRREWQTDWDHSAKVALLAEGLDALAADILLAGLESEGMLLYGTYENSEL